MSVQYKLLFIFLDEDKSRSNDTLCVVDVEEIYQERERCTWCVFRVSENCEKLELFQKRLSGNCRIKTAFGQLYVTKKKGLHILGYLHFSQRTSPKNINDLFVNYNEYYWSSIKKPIDIIKVKKICHQENDVVETNFIVIDENPEKDASKTELKNERIIELLKKYGHLSDHELTKALFRDNVSLSDINNVKKRKQLEQKLNLKDSMINEAKKIKWKEWQQALINELIKETHPREIIVVIDKVGNAGKTFFMKNWKICNEDTVCNLTNGKTEDLLHIISKKPNVNTVFLNLPRSLHGAINYEAIESIKDGEFSSNKYEGIEVTIPPTKLVIFTNKPLKWSKISQDRWKIMVIHQENYKWHDLWSYKTSEGEEINEATKRPFECVGKTEIK